MHLIRSKLAFGDYALPPAICVDTKASISELAYDIDHDHARFKREVVGAKDAGIQLVVLAENTEGARNILLPLAEAAGRDLSRIGDRCECDCTSLASVCLIAGGVPVSGGHAVIVTAGLSAGGGFAVAVSGDVTELARAVIAGRYGNGDARRAALGRQYDAVQAEVNRLLSGTVNAAGTSTGAVRLIAGRYKVVCNTLNVRSALSLSASVVVSYSYGQCINSIAADTVQADGYTWAHYVAYRGATRYVAVGTTDGGEKYLMKM